MQGTTPTPSPKSSLDQNIDEQAAQKNLETENLYAEIKKKPKDASGAKKHSSESSDSTDRENKSSSCSTEDEKNRSTEHKEEHHSRSSSSTDKKHRHSSRSTEEKERRHKSSSHGEEHHSRPSSLASKKQENELTYIDDQLTLPPVSNTPGAEGLRHRGTQPAPPKPPRNGMPSQSSDGASTSSSKESSPPPYEFNKDRKDSGDSDIIYSYLSWPNTTKDYKKIIMNSLSKFKTKLAYPIQQRAFIIPSVAFITFIASYSILMPKYYASIQNLTKDPLLSIPIIIASLLFVASMMAFISNLQDTRIKKTATQGDNEVFAKMKSINNEKCIRSIELDLSNNTHYTLLDGRKYKTLVFKKLALTLNRPLICAEIAAFVTLTSTYLLTKYFEIGYNNLADSLLTFNTNNMELIGFTAAAGVILMLFMCSFVHYYRKECVEGLKITECPRNIASFNEEFIEEAKSSYNRGGTLSSGKHSEGKAASLTINQAVVEYYNDKAVIVTS